MSVPGQFYVSPNGLPFDETRFDWTANEFIPQNIYNGNLDVNGQLIQPLQPLQPVQHQVKRKKHKNRKSTTKQDVGHVPTLGDFFQDKILKQLDTDSSLKRKNGRQTLHTNLSKNPVSKFPRMDLGDQVSDKNLKENHDF